MTLQELFDELLDTRSVTLQLGTVKQVESLRVQLTIKWNKYKDDLSACGFLSEELEACSLCKTSSRSEPGKVTFLLQPKRRTAISYEIIPCDSTKASG